MAKTGWHEQATITRPERQCDRTQKPHLAKIKNHLRPWRVSFCRWRIAKPLRHFKFVLYPQFSISVWSPRRDPGFRPATRFCHPLLPIQGPRKNLWRRSKSDWSMIFRDILIMVRRVEREEEKRGSEEA